MKSTLTILFAILCLACSEKSSSNEPFPVLEVQHVTDSLHLARLAPEYLKADLIMDKREVRRRFPQPSPLKSGFTVMAFLVPGGGVTKAPRADIKVAAFDDDLVYVDNIFPWTPNDNDRLTALNRQQLERIERDGTAEFRGMKCLSTKTLNDPVLVRYDCLAKSARGEKFVMSFEPPAEGMPQRRAMIRAKYYSEAYGGLTIEWSTGFVNADKWIEIDKRLWEVFEERNVVVN